MANYQNGVIYVINVGEQKYVGSTTDFKSRKRQHRWCINHPDNSGGHYKLYKAIRENGGEWQMEIYKEFPCDSKRELLFEEERVRKELGAELNEACCGSGLTKVEYKKHYYQDNKQKVNEQSKQRYLENREMKLEYHKQYYQKNSEKVNKRNKQYQEQNREKIREQRSQKIECPICGSMICRRNIKQHQQSAKCKRIAEQRAEEVESCIDT